VITLSRSCAKTAQDRLNTLASLKPAHPPQIGWNSAGTNTLPNRGRRGWPLPRGFPGRVRLVYFAVFGAGVLYLLKLMAKPHRWCAAGPGRREPKRTTIVRKPRSPPCRCDSSQRASGGPGAVQSCDRRIVVEDAHDVCTPLDPLDRKRRLAGVAARALTGPLNIASTCLPCGLCEQVPQRRPNWSAEESPTSAPGSATVARLPPPRHL
jgi:hypothetical protein